MLMERLVSLFRWSGRLPLRRFGFSIRSNYSQKSLSALLRVDLVEDKSAEEISELWKQYHHDKDCISAVIPSRTYDEIFAKTQLCPRFVYPCPIHTGYEFYYGEFSGHLCYFTHLQQFQQRKENSTAALSITHYPEFKESKDIVLMRGDYSLQLDGLKAQFLANLVSFFYVSSSFQWSLVRQFNFDPENFDYKSVINVLESSGAKYMKSLA
ncbi:ATP synthase mitochondrial F1 complex assembly factor 1-like [Oscarella lobularis]|uniref:ATP synthase mitochondrial F1 complex assembly factor 1-like n=1 Tax=Oscarella lobularis TaxID=121494 RepID=UPI003313A0AE